MIRKLAAALALLVLAALAGACAGELAVDMTRHEIDLTGAPVRGAAEPRVVLVEFIDIECPYCAAGARLTQELLALYPDALQVAFRHYPIPSLHEHALDAAIAVECAGEQQRFWEMLDRLVAPDARLDAAALAGHAAALGLDAAAYQACRTSTPPAARVNADWQAGRALDITATPTFFLNGLRVVGLRSRSDFVALIDRELAAIAATGEAAAAMP